MTLPLLAAAGAIVLWSTLAALGLTLAHLPPFLLTGCALVIGAIPGIAQWRQWRVPLPTLLLGIGGLFGFPFPAVSRAAPGASGRGQSRQLSVAAADRRADAGAAARLAPDVAAWTGGAAGPCRRRTGNRRRADDADRALGTRFRARRGIRDRVGVLLAAVPARAAVFIVGDRRLCVGLRVALARVPRAVRAASGIAIPATSSSWLRWAWGRWARHSICGTSR